MKNKNTIISVVVIILVIIGLALIAQPSKSENKEINNGQEVVDENSAEQNFHPAITENNTVEDGGNVFSAPETLYDFGSISMKDGKVSHKFTVTNTTSSDVLLERVVTSCMCTVAYIVSGENKKGPFGMPGHGGPVPKSNYTIKAGETIEIEAVFDPNAHGPAGVGLIERVIALTSDAGDTLELTFRTIVTP